MATYYAVGANSKFYKSIDDGNTWSVSTLPVAGTYAGVHFIDTNTGWVCGYSSDITAIILKTTNGGANWVQQITPIIIESSDWYTLNVIKFVDANVGYAAGAIDSVSNKDCTILKTTDGGNTWTYIQTSSLDVGGIGAEIYEIIINGSDTLFLGRNYIYWHDLIGVYLLNSSNVLTMINNGFDTFIPTSYQSQKLSSDIYMALGNNVEGSIGKSNDGGITVVSSLIEATSNCRSVWFTANNIGHIGTENGKMYRFNNSVTPSEQTYAGNGILWQHMTSETSGIAVGASGEIFKYQL